MCMTTMNNIAASAMAFSTASYAISFCWMENYWLTWLITINHLKNSCSLLNVMLDYSWWNKNPQELMIYHFPPFIKCMSKAVKLYCSVRQICTGNNSSLRTFIDVTLLLQKYCFAYMCRSWQMLICKWIQLLNWGMNLYKISCSKTPQSFWNACSVQWFTYNEMFWLPPCGLKRTQDRANKKVSNIGNYYKA